MISIPLTSSNVISDSNSKKEKIIQCRNVVGVLIAHIITTILIYFQVFSINGSKGFLQHNTYTISILLIFTFLIYTLMFYFYSSHPANIFISIIWIILSSLLTTNLIIYFDIEMIIQQFFILISSMIVLWVILIFKNEKFEASKVLIITVTVSILAAIALHIVFLNSISETIINLFVTIGIGYYITHSLNLSISKSKKDLIQQSIDIYINPIRNCISSVSKFI
uniref:MARVEL domain-containing protein n=1 Tax=Strongyloides venezuelensis TaxID=75913 RepID=A0A0K0FL52_STRVS